MTKLFTFLAASSEKRPWLVLPCVSAAVAQTEGLKGTESLSDEDWMRANHDLVRRLLGMKA